MRAGTTCRTASTARSPASRSARRPATSGGGQVATKNIPLLLGGAGFANYDPDQRRELSTSGALPIQTPVSPNGKYMDHGEHAVGDDHDHRHGHRRAGQGPAVQRRLSRRELRREEGRRLLRLRLEQVLERHDRARSRSERRRQLDRCAESWAASCSRSAATRTCRPTTTVSAHAAWAARVCCPSRWSTTAGSRTCRNTWKKLLTAEAGQSNQVNRPPHADRARHHDAQRGVRAHVERRTSADGAGSAAVAPFGKNQMRKEKDDGAEIDIGSCARVMPLAIALATFIAVPACWIQPGCARGKRHQPEFVWGGVVLRGRRHNRQCHVLRG